MLSIHDREVHTPPYQGKREKEELIAEREEEGHTERKGKPNIPCHVDPRKRRRLVTVQEEALHI